MSEVSNKDILNAIHAFSGAMDDRSLGVDKRFDSMDKRFDLMDQRLDSMDQRFDRLESVMVTKDYLDEKLWDLRGDMVRMMDRKVHKHENQFHPV